MNEGFAISTVLHKEFGLLGLRVLHLLDHDFAVLAELVNVER